MTRRALRDLQPGDVVDDNGTRRTVQTVEPGRDDHGYPHRTVTYEDGGHLVQSPSYTVEVEG